MATKKETGSGLAFLDGVAKHIEKYGYTQTIFQTLMTIFIGVGIYFAINPTVIFERYDKYTEKKHSASTEYRLENAPKIKFYLNQLAKEIDADKVYIMEYHNGKSNPSGLQWQYADMTFLNDDAYDIADEYQNVSLVRYSFANSLVDYGFYFGTLDDLKKIDKRLALRLEASDVASIGAIMLYGDNLSSIGFIGVSYDSIPDINKQELHKSLTKYATAIAPLLDGSRANLKK